MSGFVQIGDLMPQLNLKFTPLVLSLTNKINIPIRLPQKHNRILIRRQLRVGIPHFLQNGSEAQIISNNFTQTPHMSTRKFKAVPLNFIFTFFVILLSRCASYKIIIQSLIYRALAKLPMQSSKKSRNQHKKRRTSVSTGHNRNQRNMSLTQFKQRAENREKQRQEQNEINLFHLEEHSVTHYAKCQLQQISEDRLHGQQIKMGRISGWGLSDEQNQVIRRKTQMGVYGSKDKPKNDNSKVVYGVFKRDRSKTQTAYQSNYLSKQNRLGVGEDIRKLIHLGQINAKNKQQTIKKYSYNQVVTLMPQIAQPASPNILKIKGSRGEKALPTALIQVPFGMSLKNKKIKGSNLGHAHFQKNIHLRKISNNIVFHKQYRTEGKEQSPKKNSDMTSNREGATSSNINFNNVLRKTYLNVSETKNPPMKPSGEVNLSTTSPIHHQLQKLKKLLNGQHLSYMQIGSSCPIKIHGLKSSNNIQDK